MTYKGLIVISLAAIPPKSARMAVGSANFIPEKTRTEDTIEMDIYRLLRTCSHNSYIVFFMNDELVDGV
jgi:hypothetical protein